MKILSVTSKSAIVDGKLKLTSTTPGVKSIITYSLDGMKGVLIEHELSDGVPVFVPESDIQQIRLEFEAKKQAVNIGKLDEKPKK